MSQEGAVREQMAAALKPFGWEAGDEFWRRYHSDPWVFNLANAVERLSLELAAAKSWQDKRADEISLDLAALAKVRDQVVAAIQELDAEHYPDPDLKGRGGCVMCWPKDGSWPCLTRMVADELRSALSASRPRVTTAQSPEGP